MRRCFRRLPAALACAALLSATAVAAQTAGPQPRRGARRPALELEVAQVDRGATLCMRHHGPPLIPAARIWLVRADTPQSVARAVPGVGRCAPWPDGSDRPLVPLRVIGGALDSMGLSIAVVNPASAPVARGGVAAGDLDGDGVPEHFRACASSEGVHLTVWTGPPPAGRLRWHRYFYLGYDVEPDCAGAEMREPAPGAALGSPEPPPG